MGYHTEEALVKYVKDVMSGHEKYFNIEFSEVLVDDDDQYSATIGIEPKKDFQVEDGQVVGSKQYIELSVDDTGLIQMVIGEGDEFDMSFALIYSQLYWGEAIRPV